MDSRTRAIRDQTRNLITKLAWRSLLIERHALPFAMSADLPGWIFDRMPEDVEAVEMAYGFITVYTEKQQFALELPASLHMAAQQYRATNQPKEGVSL